MNIGALLAETAKVAEHEGMPSKWVFGGVTLFVLLLLLFLVTRINLDR
jgi:hypothetical protein